MLRLTLLALALAAAAPIAAGAQNELPRMPPIGVIDFYGVRTVPVERLRAALGVAEGDPVPWGDSAIVRRLTAVPGVARAQLDRNCCEGGKSVLYVGIEERGSPSMPRRLLPAPTGAVRLPDDVAKAGEEFGDAFMKAVMRGAAGEDRGEGHALMEDSAARAIQRRFIGFAARDSALLRDVLRHSADAGQRALAAQVLAYAADKRTVVPDLVAAMDDPSGSVRNNATRALIILIQYAAQRPELGIRVPHEPFVDMLNSLVWTDRNKASWALVFMGAGRDSATRAALRARALPALADMARWKAEGHALAGAYLLGRLAGWSDADAAKAWKEGRREELIKAGTEGLRD